MRRRLPVIALLVVAVTLMGGCYSAKRTCVAWHEQTYVMGYTSKMITSSDGRVITVEEPVMATAEICSRWEYK